MPLLFISHSSSNAEITRRLVLGLKSKGITSIFLDFDPEFGIPFGHNWERELYLQLKRADAVLFLSNQDSVASRWCFAELAIARSLGKPIFPIALEPSTTHPLLSDIQHFHLSESLELDTIDLIKRALQNSGIDFNLSINMSRPPYPGLQSFTEDDAAIFFGRANELRDILNLINSSSITGDIRSTIVIGPSGCGKSSFIRAGVIPRLLPKERWVILPRMIPGERPLENLALTLTTVLDQAGIGSNYDELLSKLNEDKDYLHIVLNKICKHAAPNGNITCLFFLDQVEELFTLTPPFQRQLFFQLLKSTFKAFGSVFFIGTLRSEYINQLLKEPHAEHLVENAWLLPALATNQLSEVIEAPATKFGLEFASGLISRIVADTEGGDALPLLNFTLNQLCQKLEDKTHISISMYEDAGGVIGALQRRADEVVAILERKGQRAQVEPTLLKLVGIGHDGQSVRRRVSRNTLSESENKILQLFLEARLLKSDQDSYGATIEFSHEALLRQWPLIKRAIERSKNKLLTFARLNQLASDWESSGGHHSYLQTGAALINLLSLKSTGALSMLEEAYLNASIIRAKPSIALRLISAAIDMFIAFVITMIEIFILMEFPATKTISEMFEGPSFWILFAPHFILLRALGYKLEWSPGVRLTRLALFARNGDKPSWGQVIFRSFIFWLPLHDQLSRTILLRK